MTFAKRKLAIGAAGLAVLAGTGGAYAATQSGPTTAKAPDFAAQQQAFLDDLAKRLNVTPDKLNDAIKGAASDQIDAAVAAGKLTKEQGDAVKKRLANANGLPLGGLGFALRGGPRLGGPGGPGGPLGFGFGQGKSLSAAATFLGLSDAELRTQLQNGKSLADIAKDKGKLTADLKAAMKTAITTELDQQVKDKKLTADQEKQLLADLDARLDDLINNTPPHGPGRPGFGFGPGMSLSAAAKFLGLSDADLRTQLENGKSLADIAKDKGKSTADLKAAMKTAITTELDQLVKDKKLTADQEKQILSDLDARLDDLINDTPPKGGPRFRFHHP
jgi:uncharacterized coiled-coil protein SlyX